MDVQLNSIDNMRVDGKFMVGGDIPEGQGSVNDLLAECFELSYDLRVAAETENEPETQGSFWIAEAALNSHAGGVVEASCLDLLQLQHSCKISVTQ